MQSGGSAFRARAAYGILQFIMRHTYLLIAILGVCFVAAGQAAKQQPKPKTPASAATPAQPQPPSDEELMAKNPAQREIVGPEKTVEGVFGKTVNPVVFARFVAEETGAHHRGGSKRNEKRDGDGHAENDSKLAE